MHGDFTFDFSRFTFTLTLVVKKISEIRTFYLLTNHIGFQITHTPVIQVNLKPKTHGKSTNTIIILIL